MENLDERYTVQFIRKLRPYRLLKGGHNVDPFVQKILNKRLDADTLDRLSVYTRGMYDLTLHYKNFSNYIRPLKLDDAWSRAMERDSSWRQAKDAVSQALIPLRDTRPIDTDDIDLLQWKPQTAAGYGYVGKKADNYLTARNNAIRALRDFDRWRNKYRFTPDKAFARSQLALKENPKIRHVWGRAFHNLLIEMLFSQPLTEKCLLNDTPIYIGKDLHKDMPYSVISLFRDNASFIYGLDVSAFDSRLCRTLIRWGLEILKELFIFSTERDVLVFDFIEELFTHTYLIMPDGNLFLVLVGVPSGTGFTQIMDSICNLIITYAIQIHFYNRTLPTYVLGDDSIYAYEDGSITTNQIRQYVLNKGIHLNMEKSILTRNYSDIIFLGHNFYGSKVTRDEFVILSLALFTEDPLTRPQQSAIRIASLIYDSGFNSFSMYKLYKEINSFYEIDWTLEKEKPADTHVPFTRLFVLS